MNKRIKTIQKLIHFNEKLFFYPKLKKFFKNAISIENPVIFDIGSNKGQSISFFSGVFKDAAFHSFEPNKRLYKGLQDSFGTNPKVVLNNVGVSSQKGSLVFNENILDETSTFEELNHDSSYLKRKASVLGVRIDEIIVNQYEVKVITLAEYVAQKNIQTIDILKIDVEGHELQCLKGLFEDPKAVIDIKFIQLEDHYDDMYQNNDTEAIKLLLEANGYKVFHKIKHGFGDFYEVIYSK
jgi:FkbM family methyltransferase